MHASLLLLLYRFMNLFGLRSDIYHDCLPRTTFANLLSNSMASKAAKRRLHQLETTSSKSPMKRVNARARKRFTVPPRSTQPSPTPHVPTSLFTFTYDLARVLPDHGISQERIVDPPQPLEDNTTPSCPPANKPSPARDLSPSKKPAPSGKACIQH